MRRTFALALAGSLALGCGTKKPQEAGRDPAKPAPTTPGADQAGTPTQAAAQPDPSAPIWALAPEGAAFGLVAAPGAFATVVAQAGAIKTALLATEFAPVIQRGLDEYNAEAGFDVFDPAALAARGLDVAKPFAVFVIPKGTDAGSDDRVFMLVPVGDRTKFRELTKATLVKGDDGIEYDKLKGTDDKGVCADTKVGYVCANTMADVQLLGAPHKSELAEAVAKLPSAARGEVTAFVELSRIASAERELAELAPVVGRPKQLAFALHLADDGATLVAHATGDFGGIGATVARARSVPAGLAGQTRGAVAVTRVLADPAPLLLLAPASLPIPATDIDARTQLLDQLTGDVQLVAGGKELLAGQLLVGVKDTAVVGKAFKSLCELAKVGLTAQKVPGVTLEVDDAGCHGVLDLPLLIQLATGNPALSEGLAALPYALEVGDGFAVITTGEKIDRKGDVAAETGSADAHAAMSADTSAALWLRSFDLGLDRLPPKLVAAVLERQENKTFAMVLAFLHAKIYELSMHLAVGPSAATGTLRLTTLAGGANAADKAKARAAVAGAAPWLSPVGFAALGAAQSTSRGKLEDARMMPEPAMPEPAMPEPATPTPPKAGFGTK